MAGDTGDVVEDRPEAGGRRESSLEFGVPPDESSELVGGQSGECSIERVAVGRGFRGEITAANNAREREAREVKEAPKAWSGLHLLEHTKVGIAELAYNDTILR